MIKPDISHVKDIHEFYSEIKKQQSGAHGIEYIAHHDALIKCAQESETIKEIGVCQGATLAGLMLTNPKKLTGIDIMPKYFNPYKQHFVNYAQQNNIDFSSSGLFYIKYSFKTNKPLYRKIKILPKDVSLIPKNDVIITEYSINSNILGNILI